MLYLLFLLAAVFLAWYLFAKTAKRSYIRSLRSECRRKLRMSSPSPDAAMGRHMVRLKEKYPDKPEAWYLEKLLHDLDRDRR